MCPSGPVPTVQVLNAALDTTNIVTFDDMGFASTFLWQSESPLSVSSRANQSITISGPALGPCRVSMITYPNLYDVSFDSSQYWAGSTTEKPLIMATTSRNTYCLLEFDPPISAFVMRANKDYMPGTYGWIEILDKNSKLMQCAIVAHVSGANTYSFIGATSVFPIAALRIRNDLPTVYFDNIQYISCDSGFTYNGTECVDVDECLYGLCGEQATCSNSIGSYSCACEAGFEFNSLNVTCDDINECLHGACGDHSTCTNTNGSYSCACDSGYQLNNQTILCEDINECTTLSPCSSLATCTNTDGSFTCSCNTGYTGDGRGQNGCTAVQSPNDNTPGSTRPSSSIVSSANIVTFSAALMIVAAYVLY